MPTRQPIHETAAKPRLPAFEAALARLIEAAEACRLATADGSVIIGSGYAPRKERTVPRRTTRRRIGVPDAFRRLPMDEEDLAGLPSFRVIRVSTEAQDYRGGPEGQAHELDLAERRTGTAPTGLELRDASPGWDAGRLEPALAWAAEGRVKVGLVPYFSRFMRDPALAFAFRDAFHARGCVLYFADRRLLSSDPARQGDFGEQAVKAQIDNLDRARSIAGGIAAKFRTHRDPGGHPALGFRRSGGLRPVLEPDPAHIGEAREIFELYASGRYSDDTLALEAARRGYVSVGTGRPLIRRRDRGAPPQPGLQRLSRPVPRLLGRGAGRGPVATATRARTATSSTRRSRTTCGSACRRSARSARRLGPAGHVTASTCPTSCATVAGSRCSGTRATVGGG